MVYFDAKSSGNSSDFRMLREVLLVVMFCEHLFTRSVSVSSKKALRGGEISTDFVFTRAPRFFISKYSYDN